MSKLSLAEEELLIKDIATEIRVLWAREARATSRLEAANDGDGAQAVRALNDFVHYCSTAEICGTTAKSALCLVTVGRMLARVVEVDMSLSKNRKGDLPAAMGIVSRRDNLKRIPNRVIYFAMDHARFGTGVAERPIEECAGLVAMACEISGKFGKKENGGFTIENIIKIYQRLDENALDFGKDSSVTRLSVSSEAE